MGDNFRENIMLTIKLFDALISPILLYGSEIWGITIVNVVCYISTFHAM